MKLETEGKGKLGNPPWDVVEEALRELDQGLGNSYAILSIAHSNYVQALRGLNGYHLEWRITGDDLDKYIHYRAANRSGSSTRKFLVKCDVVNDGQQRDLLSLDSVIEAFRAFFDRKAPPASLLWRVLDL
ncbi:hypothetical protein [Haloferula sp.]|uniref:hypothetical protein n=1 Tax=Haloferula sp. TaxID=2497595 RepID=UPI003C767467